MKILIVEDEPSLRELIQQSLEKERYVTEVATDFEAVLEKTRCMITIASCSTSCFPGGVDWMYSNV